MDQSKFSLADVLTVLTALLFGFACFLSINFFTLGNTKQSIIISVLIAVLLSGTALGAKLLKRTNSNFKACFIWEIILLILFTGLTCYFTYWPFSHYFLVSEQKEKIQTKLSTTISEAENMFTAYEQYATNRKSLYKSKLNSVVAAKGAMPSEYANYGFVENTVSDEKQIQNKLVTLHGDLFPTNYSDTIKKKGIKEVATTWLSYSKDKVADWKPIGIVSVLNEVEENSTGWRNKLVALSTIQEKGDKAAEFSYDLSPNNVKKEFTMLGNPTPIAIGLAAFAYLIMLFSYIITKRHSRYPGIKVIFGTGKAMDNEL